MNIQIISHKIYIEDKQLPDPSLQISSQRLNNYRGYSKLQSLDTNQPTLTRVNNHKHYKVKALIS